MENLPWERQPEETNSAWAAFQAYRDMPPGSRSLRGAYKKLVESKQHQIAPDSTAIPPSPSGAESTISSAIDPNPPSSWKGEYGYFKRFKWEERVRAYDREQERRRRQERDKLHQAALNRLRQQLMKDADTAAEVARIAMRKGAEGLKNVDMKGAKPGAIAAMLRAAASLQQVANETTFVGMGLDELMETLEDTPVSDLADVDESEE